MPIHDWTRIDAGIFHDFHQTWMEATYQSAWENMPIYWRDVLAAPDA